MKNTIVCTTPLIEERLAIMRDKNSSVFAFRRALHECGALMSNTIVADFPTRTVDIETPLEATQATVLAKPVTIVAILRAALGFVEGLSAFLPHVRIGHLGFFRDEETLQPVSYYQKLPPGLTQDMVIIADPMLATGGSMNLAIDVLKKAGCSDNIVLASVIAAPEGIAAVREKHGDLPIYTAAVDRGLNEKGYILPGLGDAGDRQYGT